ncbi:MAG: S8 family serine peptidase [Micromonosporaceae bacterium]|nr:S8 family serine peptidase [Micromonosporaceae bacterium]
MRGDGTGAHGRNRGGGMRRRLASAMAGAMVLGLVVGLAPGSGAGATPPPGPPGPGSEVTEVTLVTGDVVQVERTADGRTIAGVEQGAGPSGAFRVYERGGHTHVVPLTAQPYLDSGLLDPRLFDVTLLADQGYDDGSTSQLPLIIEYGAAARAATAAPDGARPGTALPSIGGRAVAADKAQAQAFWADVAGAAAPAARTTARFDDGITRIWLDGQASASLSRSVPLVGAPAAWEQGYDGTGVTVAVLDTGIDADHPDLAGQLAGSRSFTPDGTVEDRFGHGTHVASIAAGTGADPAGSPGVAPGAGLLVGKVLGDTGFGQESWIVAGMEWAVQAGAEVVNLSLGSFPTDGTDPMSQAVDALSEASDTLFVIAAGNSGPGARTVSAPATADSALAVGNARLDGTLNRSSSRGPRVIDNAIKPEISAPGTGIVAARAGGGHVAASGTSMAAPHVAGAAAILAQQHPEWTGEQLHAALVASSVPLDGATVWEQGAGRLAVDRAVAQTVQVSDGALDLGYLDLDTPGDELIRTRRLDYRNDGPEPVTLDLAVALTGDDGAPAPGGPVTVEPAQLTLAPGQTAPVTVRLDATDLPAGQYAGRLVATGGPVPVTTALGFYRQGDLVDVTISLTDRRGQPAGGHVTLLNYDRGVFEPGGFIEGSVAPGQARTFRIPRATYSITAMISTMDESGRFLSELSMVTDPQRSLDRNARLAFDSRDARPVEVDTPRDAAPEVLVLGWTRGPDPEKGNAFVDSLLVLPEAGEVERVSAAPTASVTDGTFDVYTTWHLAVPWLTATVGRERFVPTYLVGAPRYQGAERAPVVDVGTSAAGHDLDGAVALLTEEPGVPPAQQVAAAAEAGALLALVTPAEPGLLRAPGVGLPIPAATLSYPDGQRLRDQLPGTVQLAGVIDPPYTYDLIFHDPDRVPPSMAREVDSGDLATVEASYRDDGNSRPVLLTRHPSHPCTCSLVRVFGVHTLPYQRTEYVSTGDGAVWSVSVQGGLTSNLRARDLVYQPRHRYSETWGAAPLAPTAAPAINDPSTREGDTLHLRVSPIADASGKSGNSRGPSAGVLTRDGELVQELFAGFGDVPVPAGEADYRLEVSTANGTPATGQLSTSTETAWSFRSGHVDGPAQPLPLLSPVLALPLSVENAHDRRVPLIGQLHGAYPDHAQATLRSAGIWVSYDDGAQWRKGFTVPLLGGRMLAVLPPAGRSAADGYASLRVELTDRSGNAVEQTVIRAYRLG